MARNKINDLRVVIYQTRENNPVLKRIKTRMFQTLVAAERRFIIEYINKVTRHKEIDW